MMRFPRFPWCWLGLVAYALSPLSVGATLILSADGATVYDTVNGVSWLSDFNLPATNRFGLPICSSTTDPKSCIKASGSMSYQAAAAWVAAMNAANYLGHDNWQLPTTPILDSTCSFVGPQNNSFGYGCLDSALGSLYNTALAFTASNTAVPIPPNTVGPFSNFQPYLYWSQSANAQTGSGFSTFSFATGWDGSNTIPHAMYVLPMIAGKLPGTPATSGSGLQVNPGGQTIYDPIANVTWLANANIAASNTFGLPVCRSQGTPRICVNRDGAMTADSAAQFIAGMNAGAGYLGITTWQLPTIPSSCGAQFDCDNPGNPMRELYYNQLHLGSGTPVVATPDVDVGPFAHMQPYFYWTCQGSAIRGACDTAPPAPGFEWSFSFGNGFQGTDVLANDLYVVAYFPGAPSALAVNYEGLWWKSPAGSESGWGVNITHQGNILFATWFTYDTDGSGLWLVMSDGVKTGPSTYSGELYRTTGPAFSASPWSPSQVAVDKVGTATFTFTDANNGTFSYSVNGVAQSKPITRQVFSSPVPQCIAGGIVGAAANYQDLWWNSPAGSESGWGLNVTQQGDILFATWFTYDTGGKGMWLVMSDGAKTASGVYSGNLYRTTGPPFSADPWNTSLVAATQVGTATLSFTDANNGTFAYTVNGITQSKAITRQAYSRPATVCSE